MESPSTTDNNKQQKAAARKKEKDAKMARREMDEMLESGNSINFQRVKQLVEAGAANVNQINQNDTLLSKTVRDECDLACCKWLIERSSIATINRMGEYGYTPLYNAIRDQRLALAKLLIQNGANANTLTEDGKSSPLHHACYYGYIDFVKLMVEEGKATLTTVDVFGRTPLFLASFGRNFEIVKYLLEHDDADASSINIMDEDGRIPFMIAQQEGYTKIANLIKEENNKQQFQKMKKNLFYCDKKPILTTDELQFIMGHIDNRISSFLNPTKNMDQFLKLVNSAEVIVLYEQNCNLPTLKNLEDKVEECKKELQTLNATCHNLKMVHDGNGDDDGNDNENDKEMEKKVMFGDNGQEREQVIDRNVDNNEDSDNNDNDTDKKVMGDNGQKREQVEEELARLIDEYEEAKSAIEQRRIDAASMGQKDES